MKEELKRNFSSQLKHPPIEECNTPLQVYVVKHNLSNRVIAHALGIHYRYASYIVNGSKIPSRELAMKIQEYTKGEVKAVDMLQLN